LRTTASINDTSPSGRAGRIKAIGAASAKAADEIEPIGNTRESDHAEGPEDRACRSRITSPSSPRIHAGDLLRAGAAHLYLSASRLASAADVFISTRGAARARSRDRAPIRV